MEAVPAVCTLISLHEKTEPYRKDSDWTVMLQTAMNQLQVFEYLNGCSLVMNRPFRRWPPSWVNIGLVIQDIRVVFPGSAGHY
jgi:hypothetical protein